MNTRVRNERTKIIVFKYVMLKRRMRYTNRTICITNWQETGRILSNQGTCSKKVNLESVSNLRQTYDKLRKKCSLKKKSYEPNMNLNKTCMFILQT